MSWLDALDRADDFFEKRGALYDAVRWLAHRMAEERVPYAVIGRMAMAAHGYRMYAGEAIDVLTTPAGAAVISALRDAMPDVQFRVRCVDECPETVELDGYRVITLPKLIELKLVTGLSAPHRLSDLGDVMRLLRGLKLPRSLADLLAAPVREEYLRMWEAAQTPDAIKEEE